MKTTAKMRSTTRTSGLAGIIRRPMRLAWLAGMVCAVITSCSDPTGPSETATLYPGTGSTFIYKETSFRGDTSEWFDTVTVTRTDLTIGGRKGVVEFRHRSNDTYESYTYLQYDAGGDVSEALFGSGRLNSGDTAIWVTYPFGSRVPMEASFEDDTTDNPYVDFPLVRFRQKYVGEVNEKVAGREVTARSVAAATSWIGRSGDSLTMEATISYAPSVRNFTTRSESSGEHEYSRRELVSYTLKP